MQRRTYRNEEPGAAGEMIVEYDLSTGRVNASGTGFWSTQQTKAFFDGWRRIIAQIHRSGLSVVALIDLCQGTVQAAQVVDILGDGVADLYREGDVVAMLVPKSLTKMQMRRVIDLRYHQFFVSREDAEGWLASKVFDAALKQRVD